MDDAPILICYDDSPGARRAVAEAAVLFGDRHAVVLDVAPPLTRAESYVSMSPMPPDFDEVNAESGLEHARPGAELARQAGLKAEARTEVMAPTWQGVVYVADEIGAAVIVIGSRGLSGISELLKGSLSHEVAEHAGRPVLIVPPPRSS
jgi:nucleotide-binding universal stress UspA family protein